MTSVLVAGGFATRQTHAQSAAADPWAELSRPGAIILFRHASAPGGGDPPGMRLGDCSTQRNLSEGGRAEARRIGERMRDRRIAIGAVLTSQWCRTRETAALAFGDTARDEPAFNSFFGEADQARDAQTARADRLLRAWKGPGVLVVVTHQVNITALTGHVPASGEGVVLRPGDSSRWKVVAVLPP